MTKHTVIQFAKRRLAESSKQNQPNDTAYWAAYLDGAIAQQREDQRKAGDEP